MATPKAQASIAVPQQKLSELLRRNLVWLGRTNCDRANDSRTSGSTAHHQQVTKAASFGIAEIDSCLAPNFGLSLGNLHEWYLGNQLCCRSKDIWYAPLIPTALLLSRLLLNNLKRHSSADLNKTKIVWVGKRLKPSYYLLENTFAHLKTLGWEWEEHCLFIAAASKAERLFAATQFLQTTNTLAVVFDASKFSLLDTRRVQLMAQKFSPLCLALKPPWESKQMSTARSKWVFSPTTTNLGDTQLWSLELIKSKGAAAPRQWLITLDSFHFRLVRNNVDINELQQT